MRCPLLLISLVSISLLLPFGSGSPVADAATSGDGASISPEVWMELLDGEGNPQGERAAELVEVLAGGRIAELEDRGAVGSGWRVVLYFDLLLSDPMAFRNATIELAERARGLTALGEVEIVLAGEEVRLALPPTRDPDALSQALSWLRLREDSLDRQAVLLA